ncbi:MAG: DUF58 domain-containing protein [Nannocystaceae bacterium]
MASASKKKRVALWQRRLRARDRSLQITKAGWLFILFTIAVGFAAINSGANLLHVVFGAQLGIVIASGVLSERMLQRAQCRMAPHAGVHAGGEATLRIEVRNTSETRHLLSVSVEHESDGPTEGAGSFSPVFAVAVAPERHVELTSRINMPRRGRHPLPPAALATRFPFGLFIKRKRLAHAHPIVVYPKVHRVALRALADLHAGSEDGHAHGLTRTGEFHGLRAYADGDDARHIHWKATARRRQLVVAEFQRQKEREIWLQLEPGTTGDADFERRVEHIASLALALLRSGHARTALRYGSETLVDPGQGRAHERIVLERLAQVGTEAA